MCIKGYLRIWPVSIIRSTTDNKLAIKAPPASDVMVAIVEVFNGAWFSVETPQVIAAAMSNKSTTKLEASTVDPKCVLSPNFITVQIKLTINAANNSYT